MAKHSCTLQYFYIAFLTVCRLCCGFARRSLVRQHTPECHKCSTQCTTTGQLKKWERCVNVVISESHVIAIIHVCVKNMLPLLRCAGNMFYSENKSDVLRYVVSVQLFLTSCPWSALCWIWLNWCAMLQHLAKIEALHIRTQTMTVATKIWGNSLIN